MRLAIMQPYFFPYIGYFQLIAAVDRFVCFDDVAFINRGWINRNRILVDGRAAYFTVPLKGASQNRRICDIELAWNERWRRKFLQTLQTSYGRAPHYQRAIALVERVLECKAESIAQLARQSLQAVCKALELDVQWVETSRRYDNQQLRGQDRIIDMCLRDSAETYVNPSGGREIYDPSQFKGHRLELRFLRPRLRRYQQFGRSFVSDLSILDVLMFNAVDVVRDMVHDYTLEE